MKLKLFLLLVFISSYSWSQAGSTKTYTNNGTFPVPAGVTSVIVQAWGGGGSGGGASGAPLLLGRGAAGGGGGAYASAPILVTPGATLNVVVASQIAGTTGAGASGGNSTITGFESTILAAGGSGGSANNTGGSPLGGIGGTIAASAGSSKFAGTNGGNGNSWNLLGLLLSSGAGGAGAGSGGAGGTAVSGLLLSNAPGNAGSPPGGGGSGAINSALVGPQIGGAGAAGRIIISYSCPNYSITSATATSVCASSGTTSTITLTGSAASLPIGNYVVTYNRSSPSGTALIANLAVSTAGTGIFTAVGLTTAGSSTITITKLESNTCSSVITANNTATVQVSPASVGGTVNGGTTICTGSASGLLTLSGHTGLVVKWQSAVSPFSTWTDIANTTTTYTSGVLTETTQFRAVVGNGSCATANSAPTTVTVNPLPTITTSFLTGSFCSEVNETYRGLPYTATTGSPVTYSIVWDSSPANSFTNVIDAALLSSPIAIVVPGGAVTGTYSGTLTVKNADGCISIGKQFFIGVEESPTIATTGTITTVNASTSSQNASLTYTATTSNPVNYYIEWDAAANAALLTNQGDTPFTFASGGGVINTIVIPANVPAGTYNGILYIDNDACFASQSISITINALPTIALAPAANTRCSTNDGSASGTSLSYTGTTGSPVTYSIVWDASPTNNFVAVTDAALPTSPITIAIPAGTIPSTYTGTLTVKDANGAVSSPGSIFTVTTNETPLITTTGTITPVVTNANSQITTLAYAGVTGNPISYFIDWNFIANDASLADQPSTPFAFSPSGGIINNIQVSANVPAGDYIGMMSIYNGLCYQNVTVYLTINALPTIALAPATEDICPDVHAFVNSTTLSYGATTGTPITYSIVWDASPANNLAGVTDATLPTSPILINIPGNTNGGIYTGTLTVKDANGTVSLGSVFTLKANQPVNISAPGFVASVDPVTTSTSSQTTTFTYTSTSGNPTSYSIDWDQQANNALLADQPITPFAFVSGGGIINNIEISADVFAGAYRGILKIYGEKCETSLQVSIVINKALPTITLAPAAGTRCSTNDGSASGTSLSYTGTTGSPVTYSIVWDASPTNNFVAVTDAALPASPITIAIPAGTIPSTYTGTLTVKDANGAVSSPGSIFTVTTNETPLITTTGTIAPVVTNANSQITTLAYAGVTGNPISYFIDWNFIANDASLADQPSTPFAFFTVNVPL